MRYLCLPLLMAICLLGCATTQSGASNDLTSVAEPGGKANDFNPYMRDKLPNTRQISSDGARMLNELGATAQSIEGEAKHRKSWREEVYPVVFGERKAPHEIIVVLNFSNPASEQAWQAVVAASKSLSPNQCKIVVFSRSDENYALDLMGLTIWLAQARPDKAMPWLTQALSRWNAVKNAQKAAGQTKKFNNEYDSTGPGQQFPIHYTYLSQLQPPISANHELAISKYCYNAGNINMYQATQICKYYGVAKLPAVIVDGKVISSITPEAILAALGK